MLYFTWYHLRQTYAFMLFSSHSLASRAVRFSVFSQIVCHYGKRPISEQRKSFLRNGTLALGNPELRCSNSYFRSGVSCAKLVAWIARVSFETAVSASHGGMQKLLKLNRRKLWSLSFFLFFPYSCLFRLSRSLAFSPSLLVNGQPFSLFQPVGKWSTSIK